jgi:dimethylsulfoniopropionate demethylase
MDGFEIYLADHDLAEPLWDMIITAGEKFNISPGGPNQINSIEEGLLGYGNEMTMNNNPLKTGFGKFCNLTRDIDFI